MLSLLVLIQTAIVTAILEVLHGVFGTHWAQLSGTTEHVRYGGYSADPPKGNMESGAGPLSCSGRGRKYNFMCLTSFLRSPRDGSCNSAHAVPERVVIFLVIAVAGVIEYHSARFHRGKQLSLISRRQLSQN